MLCVTVPVQCIYMFSGRDSRWKTVFAMSTGCCMVNGGLLYYCGGQQKDFHQNIARKYFAHLSDEDLVAYDAIHV